MTDPCAHIQDAKTRDAVKPSARGCEECLEAGDSWVHLRLCLTCGHVGCCDSSPNRHATQHFHRTRHPVLRSYEPGEDWAYCYVDREFIESLPALPGEAADHHFEPR
jgi:uncharacterized UBP type Zn finger protein